MIERDGSVLRHMLKYANEITLAKNHFGDDKDSFDSNVLYRNSVAMSLLQIGELTTHLSDDFKTAFSDNINWRGLKFFRNICAHNYLGIDTDIVWNEVNNFLPKFISFCAEQTQGMSEQAYEGYEMEDEGVLEI
jgi:uncharacterized protein with HEPN domain